MDSRAVVVLGTGGTIAGTADSARDHIGYSAAQVGVQALLQGMADLAGLSEAGVPLRTEQVAQIDSKDMDFVVWQALAQRCQQLLDDAQVRAIVITHGTDTLEETAWFLHCVLGVAHHTLGKPLNKPVVLTCAMRPATAIAPDGPQNLIDALTVATTPGASGVLVVCAGELHGAQQVQKVHPYRLHAFSSGDGGPLGWVEGARLRWAHNNVPNWPLALASQAQAALEKIASGALWPRVEVLLSYAGASGTTVDALVHSGVQGLVLAATGNGTLHHALEAALWRAQASGVAVRIATRCPLGQVLALPGSRFPSAPQGLSPVKARISLMLELMGGATDLAPACRIPSPMCAKPRSSVRG